MAGYLRDLDGDGFTNTRPALRWGLKHQAWKDSRDGIVDENGDPVDPPIATCEEQALFTWQSCTQPMLVRTAKMSAQQLYNQAKELKKRHDAFGCPKKASRAGLTREAPDPPYLQPRSLPGCIDRR